MTTNTDAVPTQTLDEQAGTLQRVYDLVGMGALARTPGILLANLENMKRRADCLSGIEQLFTYQVPDEQNEWEAVDECDLNWGHDRDDYLEAFKAAMPAFVARHPELATPSVQVQAVRYFVYDNEGGYNEFKTDAEREQGHQAAIDAHLDTGCDGWSEEVTNVVSGIVTHKTVKTDVQKKPAPCAAHPDHDYGDNDCEACIAWDEYPNHEFDEVCNYEPVALLSASKPATIDQGYVAALIKRMQDYCDSLAPPMARGLMAEAVRVLLAAAPAAPSPAQDERETLTVSGKPFTAVFMNLTREEVAAISEHPKWSAGSWSHALDDRDAARAALQAAPAASGEPISDDHARTLWSLARMVSSTDWIKEFRKSLYAAPQPSPTAVALDDEWAAFEWPPLPAFPKPFLDSDKSGSVFTEHQMQGYANAYGEVVRAASPQPVEQTRALTALDADMVWPDDDGETFFHTIDDAVENEVNNAWPIDVDPPANGELELTLQLAKRIPTAKVRIFNITENGHEWEIVTAARPASGETE
jgi:hypothetical protein